jgi:hypothetical protein
VSRRTEPGYPVLGDEHEHAVNVVLAALLVGETTLDTHLHVSRIVGADGAREAALHLDLPGTDACVTIVITPPIHGAHT